MLRKLLQLLVHIIVRSTSRVKVIGMENLLNMREGAIVVSNHLGRLDAFLIFHLVKRKDLIVMIAEKYQKYAFYRFAAKHLDVLFVDRFGGDLKTVREILRRLNAGGILVMAPEGTRSVTGGLNEGRQGAAYLASKAGVPLLPVGLVGTEDKLIQANLRKLRRTDVIVNIGIPFTLPDFPNKNREEKLSEYTDEIMCQIAAMLPPSYRGIYVNKPRIKVILEQEKDYGVYDTP